MIEVVELKRFRYSKLADVRVRLEPSGIDLTIEYVEAVEPGDEDETYIHFPEGSVTVEEMKALVTWAETHRAEVLK